MKTLDLAVNASPLPRLTHLGVFTDRPDAMQAFYTATLGLVVSDTGMGNYFRRRIIFMTGHALEHHEFVLVAREQGDPPGGALFQISFKVGSLDELRSAVARAKQAGATDLKLIDHGNSWSAYFRDPDGNRVEVYRDTGWYVPQPYADELDLAADDVHIIQQTALRLSTVPGVVPQHQWSEQIAARLVLPSSE
jgi:catechol 2,3-dioxygenase